MKLTSLLPILLLTGATFAQAPAPHADQQPAPAAAPAQTTPRVQSDDTGYRIRTKSDLVFLPTRVQQKNGDTIYGLKPEQFVVEDNGVRQQVTIEEDPESAGISLVVLLQCSRSAPDELDKLRGLPDMVDNIVGDAPHEVAVVAYGEGIYKLSDFGRSEQSVPAGLDRMRPCGDTHAVTIDAVGYAANMLSKRQNRFRHAILLVSEMKDYGSKAKLPDVVSTLGATDTVIYSVAFSPGKNAFKSGLSNAVRHPYGGQDAPPPPRTPPPADESSSAAAKPAPDVPVALDHPSKVEKLVPGPILAIMRGLRGNTASQLASLSGGEFLTFGSQKEFDNSLQMISNQIHNYYMLSFRPSADSADGMHNLTVRVPEYPNAVIQTRKNYWAP